MATAEAFAGVDETGRGELTTDDARGSNAVLTDKGLARLREAWPAHLASVRRHIFDHLEGLDLAKLAAAFNAIANDAA